MKSRRSVSVAIEDGDAVLIVRRPANDEDLPNAWGLPAASLREGESWQQAAQRAGRDKLGIELAIGAELARGSLQRASYTLEMRLYAATIVSGSPRLLHVDDNVTHYQDWQWGNANDLQPAAQRGSLCSRLFLQHRQMIP